jgi:hypothetical protein
MRPAIRKQKATKKKNTKNSVAKPATVLVMRTCDANMKSCDGFRWPSSGVCAAPDWKPTKACGNGLHGLLWGEGDGELLNWDPSSKWLIVEVIAADVIDLIGKVKFPRGEVVYSGDRTGATEYIQKHGQPNRAIVGALITAGYRGTATAGDGGTATAGDGGTATAGDGGTAAAGDGGTATAGYCGTATAGYGGTAAAGHRGTIQIKYYDTGAGRHRIVTGYVGEGGIESNKKYKLQDMKLVRAD